MRYRKISGIACMLAWLAGSVIITIPNWSFLNAQDSKKESIIEAESLSIQKYVPPDTAPAAANEPKNNGSGAGIKSENDLRNDSIPMLANPDSLLSKEELRKKRFIGTGRDIGIAFATLVGWLAFMWLAANQRE
ncbi:hypothetical protein A2Y85_01665 [candidate division WOR-3 bacterium RBG_13_43_14]|uniref:Uncharacterized protein n=1 Tax=candidate division WOR-3 bacterium RBG_13_43_14 TaxID=1802590 RepID=A0A1F4U1V5_UNCW3|nr:MAG: hypothetical protein A2Y85_01665 [candidate division WOR-3 bacterium RBG_13_43_14]